jgi:hypothetical protein
MPPTPSARVFVEAFKKTQKLLGITHYRVRFEADPKMVSYASISRDAEACTAYVCYNIKLMQQDNVVFSTAVHEALHMLLYDLRWAQQSASDHVADVEDERIVSRLEPLIMKAIFPQEEGT